ncbi:MAG: IS4 family transposase [Candidatus Magasanikbacteria bacterium]|nr:IS4 family transposase [Candidatus Magasanikbacteria bacterium]
MGFRSRVNLSTLANANEKRDWRIYRDYTMSLVNEARKLYTNDTSFSLKIDHAIYAVDSTTIELSLSLFPWARLKKKRAAVKLNMGIELHGNIPSFFSLSSGKIHDVFFLDDIKYEHHAIYIIDRAYIDFTRLFHMHVADAYFVTRAKDNLSFRRLYSHRVDTDTGVRCDQTIVLSGYYASKNYPEKLRRVKYYDEETKRTYIFLTNNFEFEAITIAALYKQRWQIELFFKWMKQHLSIESFWGRSVNTVKTQICVAISAYLLVAILKKKLYLNRNSYEILQILSISIFEKIPITELISKVPAQVLEDKGQKQAQLWEF